MTMVPSDGPPGGLDMALAHRGMRIGKSDWDAFLGHTAATLAKLQVPVAD